MEGYLFIKSPPQKKMKIDKIKISLNKKQPINPYIKVHRLSHNLD